MLLVQQNAAPYVASHSAVAVLNVWDGSSRGRVGCPITHCPVATGLTALTFFRVWNSTWSQAFQNDGDKLAEALGIASIEVLPTEPTVAAEVGEGRALAARDSERTSRGWWARFFERIQSLYPRMSTQAIQHTYNIHAATNMHTRTHR